MEPFSAERTFALRNFKVVHLSVSRAGLWVPLPQSRSACRPWGPAAVWGSTLSCVRNAAIFFKLAWILEVLFFFYLDRLFFFMT